MKINSKNAQLTLLLWKQQNMCSRVEEWRYFVHFSPQEEFFSPFLEGAKEGGVGVRTPASNIEEGGVPTPHCHLIPPGGDRVRNHHHLPHTEGLPIYPCAFVDTMAPGQGVDAGGQGVRPDDDAHPDAVDGPHGDLVGAVRRTWRISKHTCAVCWLWFCHCGCFCWHAVHGHPIGEHCR